MNKKSPALAVLAVLGFAVANVASATPVTMTFDDLTVASPLGGQYVADFYSGGCGKSFAGGGVSCGGPDYGVAWTGPAVVKGPFSIPNAYSAPNALIRATPVGTPLGNAPMTMNVANGFTDGFRSSTRL